MPFLKANLNRKKCLFANITSCRKRLYGPESFWRVARCLPAASGMLACSTGPSGERYPPRTPKWGLVRPSLQETWCFPGIVVAIRTSKLLQPELPQLCQPNRNADVAILLLVASAVSSLKRLLGRATPRRGEPQGLKL